MQGHSGDLAAIEVDETKTTREVTHGELRAMVGRIQRSLTRLGVEPGDRVAGILPNTVDALAYTLATLSIGAVWTSCAPEFGARGVLDRFGQVSPAVLVVAERYVYNEKQHSLAAKGLEAAAELPGLRHVIVLGGNPAVGQAGTAAVHSADVLADELTSEPSFVRLDFDTPPTSSTPRARPVCQRRSCIAPAGCC